MAKIAASNAKGEDPGTKEPCSLVRWKPPIFGVANTFSARLLAQRNLAVKHQQSGGRLVRSRAAQLRAAIWLGELVSRELNTGLRVVSPEEERKLLENASPYLQDLIRFALNTGMRIGEIFSLRWSSVDLKKGLLTIFSPKNRKAARGSYQR